MNKILLCILDGWGINLDNTHKTFDATIYADNFNNFLKKYPNCTLQASEKYVGLPNGQMGNSEVGHAAIGLGRVILQDLVKINEAFNNDYFTNNKHFLNIVEHLKNNKKNCHVMGLLSDGGIHSHIDHIIKAIKILDSFNINTKLHLFFDGRDTDPHSGINFLKCLEDELKNLDNCKIASVCGRFYAMDRDNRWERVEKAYNAIVLGSQSNDTLKFDSLEQYIKNSYQEGISDEFLMPASFCNYSGMNDNDALFMINFRQDRVREILNSILDINFDKFKRIKTLSNIKAIGMNSYSKELDSLINTLFEKDNLKNSLGEVIANNGLSQCRVAETEKYAHVTFFFNGGIETEFKNEKRIMIPSAKVETYDLIPQMSAFELTDVTLKEMQEQTNLIVLNYANTDMVGHTGSKDAVVKAVKSVDECLLKLKEKAIENDYVLIITADHGNAECMENDAGTMHTAHTTNPVPFIIINYKNKNIELKNNKNSSLQDIAPSILKILNIKQPSEMTGSSLI